MTEPDEDESALVVDADGDMRLYLAEREDLHPAEVFLGVMMTLWNNDRDTAMKMVNAFMRVTIPDGREAGSRLH